VGGSLLLGLCSLLVFTSSCEQREATAKRPPVLYVPDNVPQDEPPPAALLVPEDLAKPEKSTPPEDLAKPTTPSDHTPPANPIPSAAATEIPCEVEAPPGMVCVPGGPFWRGNDNAKADERPRARIVLSPFFMDTYEVDNEQYFRCVEAGACDPPIKYYPMFAKPKQPVVAVSWFESDAYCRFAGKRLPTESEWEKAARGPDGEVYPWGNDPPTCDKAVYEDPLNAKGCGTGLTSNVGSRPVGRYGLYDMAGNSWEWVDDWKTDCYKGCKNECGADCMGPDPHGPCGGGSKNCPGRHEKVLKGGSWYFTGDRMRGAERRGVSPSNRGPHRLGFRCAKSLPR
jgi:formylglycine-generating enzyme required for sulfatase activity